jgi:calcineurin-like phosphoesterase family protein
MRRTYAVGDIHGWLSKLRSVVAQCEADAAGAPMRFVFVGDYIDRGPDSRGVIEFLMALQSRMGDHAIFLTGNHEAMALDALEDETAMYHWLLNGGDATLESYGVCNLGELPAAHLAWLRTLKFHHDDGHRLFVHAGINPDRPLDDQNHRDLIWIREPFLSDSRDHGRFIVHGHTPLRAGVPDLRSNRLNIDTGAAYGNALTAAIFTDGEVGPIGFLQAGE